MFKRLHFAPSLFLAAALLPASFAAAQNADESLLKNGGFEDGAAKWNIGEKVAMSQVVAEAARTGQRGLRVTDADKNGSSALSERMAVTAGQGYRLSFWAKSNAAGAAGVYLWFYRTDGSLVPDHQPVSVIKQTADWTEYKLLSRVPEGVNAVSLWIHSFSTPTVTFDIDDIRFTAATAAETAALPMPTLAAQDTAKAEPRKVPAYVVLKLDDLTNSRGRVPERWKKLGDFIRTRKIKSSIGIISNSLEGDNPEYVQWIKELHDSGLVEFWNHGYTHKEWEQDGRKLQEFSGTPYEEQKQHFVRSEELAKQKLGFTYETFGPPFGGTDANTSKALSEMPDIKIWLYGDAQNPGGKIILDRIGAVNIENPLFVPSLERFIAGYNRYPTREYFVIQGHPAQWDEARFEQFTKIVDFLLEQKAVWVTPMELAKIREGKK